MRAGWGESVPENPKSFLHESLVQPGGGINQIRGTDSGQLHHHLANISAFEKADERAHRLVDSFHDSLLVLQFAGAEIAAHFDFKFTPTIQPIAYNKPFHRQS